MKFNVLTYGPLTAASSCFRLGDYDAHQFDDDRVKAPLAKFQQTIELIETEMVDT